MKSSDILDIAIIGAGLSGVGGAARLVRDHPHKSIALFERRARIGGTWDLFRYPGVRSDSDMYTLGYEMRPWVSDQAIVEGAEIRQYIEDTAREFDLMERIRFGHRLTRANWDSKTKLWHAEFIKEADGSTYTVRAHLLYMAAGYYDQDAGHRPDFAGAENFMGQIIHPQHWPDDVNLSGKRIAVIGSGATAVTLLPALAEQAEHVTMVQRSPAYLFALPSKDVIARQLYRFLPDRLAYKINRWLHRRISSFFYQRARSKPEDTRRLLMGMTRKALGGTVDVKAHFSPSYMPWDERLCIAPDGDFYKLLKNGNGSIVTGAIRQIEADGIRMNDGSLVNADIIITATGLNLALAGKAEISVDGVPYQPPQNMIYKGALLSGLPNFIMVFGYTNGSWTLKADLVARYTSRLLMLMDKKRVGMFTVPTPAADYVARVPMIMLASGYFKRAAHLLPAQGESGPWTLLQNYKMDRRRLIKEPIDDGFIRFD